MVSRSEKWFATGPQYPSEPSSALSARVTIKAQSPDKKTIEIYNLTIKGGQNRSLQKIMNLFNPHTL